eukprot:6091378-Pyramimonas_sp.AAC.1
MLLNFAGPGVEEINVDCSSTVSYLREGRAYATAPNRPSAHFWSRIHAAFEPGDFAARKVPARSIRQAALVGLPAGAQRRGNERADRLAKLGAKLRA